MILIKDFYSLDQKLANICFLGLTSRVYIHQSANFNIAFNLRSRYSVHFWYAYSMCEAKFGWRPHWSLCDLDPMTWMTLRAWCFTNTSCYYYHQVRSEDLQKAGLLFGSHNRFTFFDEPLSPKEVDINTFIFIL